jgi:hypothetical protein
LFMLASSFLINSRLLSIIFFDRHCQLFLSSDASKDSFVAATGLYFHSFQCKRIFLRLYGSKQIWFLKKIVCRANRAARLPAFSQTDMYTTKRRVKRRNTAI